MKNLILSLTTALLLYGCYDSDLGLTDKYSNSQLNYLSPGSNPNDYPNDEFRIIGVTPGEHEWKAIVQYSGGCKDHFFFTWWNGGTSNKTAKIYLFHDGNNDSCEALVKDTVSINMEQVLGNIDISELTIRFSNASSSREITIKPELRHFAKSENCLYDVTLIGTSCGQGIWDNQWMSPLDTTHSADKIWFQPVKNGPNIPLTKPEKGNYKVGITPLFGYEYFAEDGNCKSTPEGDIIPVAVTCMQAL